MAAGLAATGALGVAGCGGQRQDADEKAGTYTVDVVRASFPAKQALAHQSTMTITVRNTGSTALPDIAVTIGDRGSSSFSAASQQSGLADASRPVWVVDTTPVGGDTAYVGTWALGSLRAGATKTFRWKVTPVVPGAHRVAYRVSAGLSGKAKAQLAGGGVPRGTFKVDVSGTPSAATVDPDTDQVIRGAG